MFEQILLYCCVFFSGIIVLVHLICSAAVLLNRLRDALQAKRISEPFRSEVSVIVVAKDEEEILPKLLSSLEAQSHKSFETILVSDRSEDRTLELMQEYRKKHGARVKVLENREDPEGLGPKQFVLDIAVEAAGGQILVFTDADCILPRTWVEHLLPYFNDPRVGVVFGQISLGPQKSFFRRFQAFDQPLIHQYNSATAGLGMPGSCFGNNLVARRAVLDDIGGFRSLGYTLTEDAALATAAGKKKWKVRVSTRTDTMIQTVSQNSWRDFINQHLRWNSGGFYHKDFTTRFGYRFITLFLIASILAVPIAPFVPLLAILPVASFVSVGLMAFLSGVLYRPDKVGYLLRLVPYTCFFLAFYSFVTTLSIFKVPLQWKGKRWRAVEPENQGE